MALRGAQFKTSHTIDNDEIGGTYCGKSLPYKNASDPTPWDMGGGHVAHWDNDAYPAGYRPCQDCNEVYNRRADEVDARRADRLKQRWS